MMNETTEHNSHVKFTLDDREVTVTKGTTVYTAAKELGIDIPIFCYQDRMPPFGACRVCLVEVEKMGKLQTSCTLVATDGMVVKTQSKLAEEGRSSILEFLLINHPLDCPICDRGGECPLQDQTVKFGPGESRFYEEKRHFTKALPLGPVLMLDRERCIACARCVRFGDIISGDHALEFIDRGYKTEVGTPDGAPAKSKFIGNTIMICPVGALTSQVYRFRARPWDNDSVKSTCTLCPVGCNLNLDSRDGEIVRTRSCENKELNDIWLCDKGWFGYQFSSSRKRLTTPLIRREGVLEPATWDEALTTIAKKLKTAKPSGKLAGFGGNPLTVEENYLFQKLMREGAGVNHVDHRIGTPELSLDEEGIAAGMELSIGECETLTSAYLFGVDLTEEFPIIWLRLKQAIDRGAKVTFAGHFSPEIASMLSKTILHAPGKELGCIDSLVTEINECLSTGKKTALFIGRHYLNTKARRAILAKLMALKKENPLLSINVLEGQENSRGARFAGMRPDIGPLNERMAAPGLSAIQVLEEAKESGWGYLHVAGANPAVKYPKELWEGALKKLDFLVVQDLFMTETAAAANVVLPTLSFVEKEGSFINIEGRVQKIKAAAIEISETLYSDAEIFKRLAYQLNQILPIDKTFLESLKESHIPFDPFSAALCAQLFDPFDQQQLYATFAPALFDHGVRMQHNKDLVQLAKEPKVRIHPSEAAKRGFVMDDKVSIAGKGKTITAQVALDSTVAENTLVLPLGFPELPVQEFGPHLQNGFEVTLRKQ